MPTGLAGSTDTITGTGGSVAGLTTITMANLQAAGLDETNQGTYSFNIIETSALGCDSDLGTFTINVEQEPTVFGGADVSFVKEAAQL